MKTNLLNATLTATLAALAPAAPAQNANAFDAAASSFKSSSFSSAKDSIPPVVVQFSPAEPGKVEQLEEDLWVMTRLLEKRLERGLGEETVSFKMNIPLLVTAGGRSVRAMYAEGVGALFMIKLNIPLVGPPKTAEKKPEATADSEWDRTRQEMDSEEEATALAGNAAGADFEEGQVETVKTLLLQSLKHASNIRSLRPDEYVAVSVFGSDGGGAVFTTGGSSKSGSSKRKSVTVSATPVVRLEAESKEEPGSVTIDPATGLPAHPPAAPVAPGVSVGRGAGGFGSGGGNILREIFVDTSRRGYGRGSVLTMRVKKSDVDAFAKGTLDFDGFKKRATLNAYAGNGTGVTSLNSWIQGGRSKTSSR